MSYNQYLISGAIIQIHFKDSISSPITKCCLVTIVPNISIISHYILRLAFMFSVLIVKPNIIVIYFSPMILRVYFFIGLILTLFIIITKNHFAN